MIKLNPYFNFPGTSEEAILFYKSVFGGELAPIVRYGDSPEAGKAGTEAPDKIMHIALMLPNGMVIMATDSIESMGHTFKPGNNFHISISVESKEQADEIFNGLSAGGQIMVPMRMEFWGAYFGMFTDKYGIQWMVNYDEKFHG